VEQDSFYNIVIQVKTELEPYELLQRCQEIEKDLGRVRDLRWGPRTIDIDILTYENFRISTKDLTIPHPYMEKREFVLAPLREIAPLLRLPSGKLIKI
jgi:2-amino-4-hydroxy-6-hydroxymethyldihydropteridine diphosphokinase